MHVIRIIFATAALLGLSGAAMAQDSWPDRSIRLIATSAAGGGLDLSARILADGLSRQLPKPVIVENNGSAGGLVATRLVAKADPDGYTFLFQGPGYVALPYLHSRPGFDVDKDFASVSLVAKFPILLVARPSLGVKSLPEFIALAKKSPGKYTFGTSGTGAASHIALEAITSQAGIQMLHVPFRGSGETITALLAGQIDLAVDGLSSQLGNLQAQRVVPLAVSTIERSSTVPDVPTLAETLPGLQYPMWVAVFAPAKTPKAILDKMSAAISRAVSDPTTKNRFEKLVVEPIGSSPAELDAFLKQQLAFNKRVIEGAHIKVGD